MLINIQQIFCVRFYINPLGKDKEGKGEGERKGVSRNEAEGVEEKKEEEEGKSYDDECSQPNRGQSLPSKFPSHIKCPPRSGHVDKSWTSQIGQVCF